MNNKNAYFALQDFIPGEIEEARHDGYKSGFNLAKQARRAEIHGASAAIVRAIENCDLQNAHKVTDLVNKAISSGSWNGFALPGTPNKLSAVLEIMAGEGAPIELIQRLRDEREIDYAKVSRWASHVIFENVGWDYVESQLDAEQAELAH